jgi:hypothetical protein
MKISQNKTFNKMIVRNLKYLAFVSLIIPLLISCTKSTNNNVPLSSGAAHLSIRMTDAPASYDAVNVDIQGVEITGPGGKAVTLNTSAGVYNLLDLANGVTALIARGDLNAGTVSQIRLILGSNNTVTVDGVDHDLKTPSAQQSGLKLQVHYDFQPDVSYAILLDFDALKSVVAQGNGNYLLKPVITAVTSPTGEIKGSVTPVVAGTIDATVTATYANNTYTSTVDADGNFLITGVPAGTYNVKIAPSVTPPAFIEKDFSSVVVTSGNTTDMGAITLQTIGSISGSVTPVVTGTIGATVTVSDGVNNYTGTVAADGTFSFSGVFVSTYTVKITPATTPAVFLEKTVTGVIVTAGTNTNMGPQSLGGIITGSISPVSAATGATVSAKTGITTPVSGTVNATTGTFMILGLTAATYDVTIVTTNPVATKTITGQIVNATATTVMSPVTIP